MAEKKEEQIENKKIKFDQALWPDRYCQYSPDKIIKPEKIEWTGAVYQTIYSNPDCHQKIPFYSKGYVGFFSGIALIYFLLWLLIYINHDNKYWSYYIIYPIFLSPVIFGLFRWFMPYWKNKPVKSEKKAKAKKSKSISENLKKLFHIFKDHEELNRDVMGFLDQLNFKEGFSMTVSAGGLLFIIIIGIVYVPILF